MMMPQQNQHHDTFSLKKHVILAAGIMSFLVFGVGGWAASATLSGAVIAPGQFVVERNVKKVQHSYGGIIAEINVKNGDRVSAGDVVLRLDPTQIKAELGVIRSQLIELIARNARLAAERDGKATIVFPNGFEQSSPEAADAAKGEVRLFEEGRKTKDSQKEQLRLKIEQTKDEIQGLNAQRDAKTGELEVVQKELSQVKGLHDKQLTTAQRVNTLDREEKRLSGERGGLTAQIARANSQISEIRVQILGIDENTKVNAQRELRTAEARIAELLEREVAAKDKLNRIDIRAPRTGVVHELAVHTVGGVITTAEQLMLIVPEDDGLAVQARIQPNDIDHVVAGRPARLRLSAFNQAETPELSGVVSTVSGDVTNDPKSGMSYYVIRLEIDAESKKQIANLKLVPGMPVEVFMATGERTPLSYLMKPLADQMKRAFRE